MDDWFMSLEKPSSPCETSAYSESTGNDVMQFRSEEEAIEELCHIVGEDSNGVENQTDTQKSCNENVTEETPTNQSENVPQVELKDPPDIDEILTTESSSITPSAHNVGILNSACQQVLKEMEQQLLALLKRNRKEQEVVLSYLNTNGKIKLNEPVRKSNLTCLGMPYFRDLQGYPPPLNKDVLKKMKNNKLLPVEFIKSPACWSSVDAKVLTTAVNKTVSRNKSATQEEIDPNKVDWMKIAATDLDGKYSATECKSKWMLNLRPGINKGKWSLKEFKNLNVIAKKLNYQNWDEIAKLLGTNRSGFQCCVKFQMSRPSKCGKWSEEENELLLKLIEKYRIRDYIPWAKVTWHFERRSLRQCQEKYLYHLADIKRGYFSYEEDFVLVYLASKLKNFGQVAKYLPRRVSTQLRSRYEYLVNRTMPSFTKEEDELLTKLMVQYPRNWSKISENFTDRSKVQCRRRWTELQKSIALERDIYTDESDDDETQGMRRSDETRANESLKDRMDLSNVKKNLDTVSKLPDGLIVNSLKYPEVYDQIIEYFKYCYKFLFGPRCRNVNNSEDVIRLSEEMRTVMSTLFVNTEGPLPSFNIDTLSTNCEFDNEDIIILSELAKSQPPSEVPEREAILTKNKVIPPNFTTLVGMRTLSLAWDKVRSFIPYYKEPPPEMYDQEIDPNERLLFTDAKKLFKSRLKTLFALPLVLSNISQTDVDGSVIYKPKFKKRGKPLSKLQLKTKAKMMSQVYRMKLNVQKSLDENRIATSSPDGEDTPQDRNSPERPEEGIVDEKPKRGRARKRKISVAERIGESGEENGGESSSADVSKMRLRSCETGSRSESNGARSCKRRRTPRISNDSGE